MLLNTHMVQDHATCKNNNVLFIIFGPSSMCSNPLLCLTWHQGHELLQVLNVTGRSSEDLLPRSFAHLEFRPAGKARVTRNLSRTCVGGPIKHMDVIVVGKFGGHGRFEKVFGVLGFEHFWTCPVFSSSLTLQAMVVLAVAYWLESFTQSEKQMPWRSQPCASLCVINFWHGMFRMVTATRGPVRTYFLRHWRGNLLCDLQRSRAQWTNSQGR